VALGAGEFGQQVRRRHGAGAGLVLAVVRSGGRSVGVVGLICHGVPRWKGEAVLSGRLMRAR